MHAIPKTHPEGRVVKKLKRAFCAIENGGGNQFETEISAEIVSKVRPRWPKLRTILVWVQQRPGQVLWIEKGESQAHAARR